MADEKKPETEAEAVTETAAAPEAAAPEAPAAEEKPAETVTDLADLKDIAGDAADADAAAIAAAPETPLREQELDQYGRAYATGRRKDATARVWLKPGKGKIIVNGREQKCISHALLCALSSTSLSPSQSVKVSMM